MRWRTERIEVRSGSCQALTFGGPLAGGIVEYETTRVVPRSTLRRAIPGGG
ncbi:hypothetical protein [Actinomadura sp. DC4]|uniref:hypothetical protein n=1 Tax=Actinomadura sp. DC4 TaxID=3055069 RepID=UPI0025B026CA|nr:hypothetical protein [Actinomadura sp. DC4]MDN3356808.1 hypothetical protein [Actinomadura sp. DC4]